MADDAAPRGELRVLTSVRGIAAWWVVLYHIRESVAGLAGVPLAIAARGYLAVDFFFLLSGFVLWLSWHARFRRDGLGLAPRFLHRRFARIWPLHAVVLAGAATLAVVLALAGRPDAAQFPPAELPLHLLLVQNWGFTDRLAWNDPAWSISVESAAYHAFPLLALAIDWRRVPSALVIGAIAAMLALLHLALGAGGAASLNDDIPRFGLIRCLAGFASGMGIAALWLRWRTVPRLPAIVAALAAMLLLGAHVAGALPETLAIPPAFAASLLALALTAGAARHPLEGRALHWLGTVSYATYLAHFLMWKAFKLAFVATPGPVGWPLIGLYLGLVLAASGALYHWIERPAQRWINALPLSRPRRPPSPALR